MNSHYQFSISGIDLPGNVDPLGVCVVDPLAAQSFAVDEPPEPTWHFELPDSAEATAILDANLQLIQRQEKSLALIRQELETVAQAGGGVSFAPVRAGEVNLAAQKDALRRSLKSYTHDEALMSYGLRDWLKRKKQSLGQSEEDTRAYEQWQTFVQQVEQMVTSYARIETAITGLDLVGVTRVGWTGNFYTDWDVDATPASQKIHTQSVHLALASRIALMRVISVVTTGAAGLALKAAVPGGQVLLLPASWRFVRDVLAELRRSWPQLKHLS